MGKQRGRAIFLGWRSGYPHKSVHTSKLLRFFELPLSESHQRCYPTEDELVISPHELTQYERLQAMNRIGQDAQPGIKWIYLALPSCILQITVEGVESDKQTFSLQLAGAGVDVSSNKVDEAYGVQVQPIEGDSLEKQPVLLSKTWLDAIEMSHLFRSFQLGC